MLCKDCGLNEKLSYFYRCTVYSVVYSITHTNTCTRTHTHIHIHIHINTHTHTHAHTHTHIHKHTHTHTHIHTHSTQNDTKQTIQRTAQKFWKSAGRAPSSAGFAKYQIMFCHLELCLCICLTKHFCEYWSLSCLVKTTRAWKKT